MEKLKALGISANEPDAVRASAAEFVLEGLYAHRRISRSEERGFAAEERKREPREEARSRTPQRASAVQLIGRARLEGGGPVSDLQGPGMPGPEALS